MSSVRLKRVAKVIAGQSPPSEEVTALTYEGLPFLQGNAEFGLVRPSPVWRCDTAPKQAQPGDILLSVRAPVGALNWADRAYGIGRGLDAIRPRDGLADPRYLWWVMHASVPTLQATATGSTYEAVTAEDVGNIPVPSAALLKQRSIADYLDRETARIDKLIAAAQGLIRLLGERMRALVDHTINTTVEESEPLGKVLQAVIDRRGITPGKLGGDFVDQGVPVVSARNVRDGRLEMNADVKFVTEAMASRWMRHPLEAADVIVTSEAPMGAVAFVIPENLPACIGQRLFALRPQSSRLLSRYLFWALQTLRAQEQLVLMSTGSTAVGIRQRYLVTLRIPIPDLSLQQSIALRLDAANVGVSTLSAKLQRQIELLIERREAVVASATADQDHMVGANS